MSFWDRFRRSPSPPPQATVTNGRFEIERDGEVAYLEYTISGNILGLIHTEVPVKMRGAGLASTLARTAFQYARDNHMKVDVICPTVQGFVSKHPEFETMVMR